MIRSEEIAELAGALAKAQGAFLPAARTAKAMIKGVTKEGKSYQYEYFYAPLDSVLDSCRQALSANDLSYVQTIGKIEDGSIIIETTLMHGSSGQWISSALPLVSSTIPQEMGAQLTYYRRYAFSALVGIAPDIDADGQAEKGTSPQPSQTTGSAQQPQDRKQAPAGTNDTPEALASFLGEAGPLFSELSEEERSRLLKKFGNAPELAGIPVVLRAKILNALIDLKAAKKETPA